MFNDVRLQHLLGSTFKYLEKAVAAREKFYRGRREASDKALVERQPNLGPSDAEYRFTKSVVGEQLIADNKWHMAQSRTFALASIARGTWLLVKEQQRTNVLLEQLLKGKK